MFLSLQPMTGKFACLQPSHDKNQGSALVITLLMILLTSALVVGYVLTMRYDLQNTRAYASNLVTEEFARAAMDLVTGELLAEIQAGSEVPGSGEGQGIFEPIAQTNGSTPGMVPFNQTSSEEASAAPNLLRRSLHPSRGLPGPDNTTNYPLVNGKVVFPKLVASQVASSEPALGGRFFPANHWNKPLFIEPTVFAQMIEAGTFHVPDWVIVTRDALTGNVNSATGAVTGFTDADLDRLSDRDPSNGSFAIGRFAYTIYDEGGLIDINVAANKLDDTDRVTKGFVNQVRLERLRDSAGDLIFGANETSARAAVDQLVDWRWPTTATDRMKMIGQPVPSGTPDPDRASVRDWGTVQTGEEAFLSRQDLLQYAKLNPSVLPQAALPFLTTFTRENSAPSFSPINPTYNPVLSGGFSMLPAAESTFDYRFQANVPRATALANPSYPVPNRNSVKAVWTADRTIRTWDMGPANPNQPLTREVEAGEQILRRRFPLSKLGLLSRYNWATGWSGQQSLVAEIEAAFGLVPSDRLDSSLPKYTWYYRPFWNGSGGQRLLTVEEMDGIAPGNSNANALPQPREPNFFELIRAGILRGEMGFRDTLNRDDQDSIKMALRIGAAIIDQYDVDDYPTQIAVTTNESSPAANTQFVVAGIENIPMFSEIFLRLYRPPFVEAGAAWTNNTDDSAYAWFEFELWNPHKNAGAPATGARPTNFRIVAATGRPSICVAGSSDPHRWQDTLLKPDLSPDTARWINYANDPVTNAQRDLETTPYQIGFTYSAATPFREPMVLRTQSGVTPGSDPKGRYDFAGKSLVGILAGELQGQRPGSPIFMLAPAPIQFLLQYEDNRPGASGWTTLQLQEYRQNNSGEASSYTFSPGTTPYATSAGMAQQSQNLTEFNNYVWSWPSVDPREPNAGVTAFKQGRWSRPSGSVRSPATPGMAALPGTDRGPVVLRYANYSNAMVSVIFVGSDRYNYSDPAVAGSQQGANVGDFVDNRFFSGVSANELAFASVVSGRDGVLRPADADRDRDVRPLWPATSSGDSTAFVNYGANMAGLVGSSPSGVSVDRLDDRPVVLNRPFTNVGEMAYAYRYLPWKTLDFSSSISSDAGLLDLFSLTETPSTSSFVSTGKVNLNTRNPQVLATFLADSARRVDVATLTPAPPVPGTNGSTDVISPADALLIANDIVAASKQFPFRSKADLIQRLGEISENVGALYNSSATSKIKSRYVSGATTYPAIKPWREATARALGDVGQVRTWNLMVDLVAQTGRYAPGSTTLSQFTVEGQKRYWLHLAVDRFTGQVIDSKVEAYRE